MGLLYLQYGKIIEAKKAFEFSLSITSTQGLGWLGQGLVNESSHKVDVFNVRQSYKYSVSLASEVIFSNSFFLFILKVFGLVSTSIFFSLWTFFLSYERLFSSFYILTKIHQLATF